MIVLIFLNARVVERGRRGCPASRRNVAAAVCGDREE
jgi:hypothetical protein